MACFETGTVLTLAAREALTLPNVRGATLRVTRGTIWLTEERSRDDIVLRPGDNWLVESAGDTVVEAKDDATICISGLHGALPRQPARAHGAGRLRAALLALFSAPPSHTVPYA